VDVVVRDRRHISEGGIVLAVVAPRVLSTARGRRGRLDLPGAAAVTGPGQPVGTNHSAARPKVR
jgi:hypothetical protein